MGWAGQPASNASLMVSTLCRTILAPTLLHTQAQECRGQVVFHLGPWPHHSTLARLHESKSLCCRTASSRSLPQPFLNLKFNIC